jgi:hypothetical protein
MRRLMLAATFLVAAALPAGATSAEGADFDPLSTYNGEVEITCTQADAAGTGSHVLNRDNTGTGMERLNIQIFDGQGTLLYELTFENALNDYVGGIGTFVYTTAPAFNPITFILTSLAGNGLPEEIDVLEQGFCDTITFVPHTVGAVDPGTGQWHLLDEAGAATSFFFGNPGDLPMMGDWDGDGIDTPGLYRQSDGFVYLRNSNTQGIADTRFFFGNPGDVPLAGDFDGDGFDTVSIFRPSEGKVYVINALGENDGGLGAADLSYFFGNPGDKPFVGDFDGDGIETIGLHRESTGFVYFRNSHTQGIADNSFFFGDPGDRLVAGDWTGAGFDTPALFRPSNSTWFFRHTNTEGVADDQFPFGNSTYLPVAGIFDNT